MVKPPTRKPSVVPTETATPTAGENRQKNSNVACQREAHRVESNLYRRKNRDDDADRTQYAGQRQMIQTFTLNHGNRSFPIFEL